MSTEEDREALAVELREVYLRTPGNRGMDAPRWVAVADAAIAALHHPVQGEPSAPQVTERQVRYDNGEWSREVEVVPAPQDTEWEYGSEGADGTSDPDPRPLADDKLYWPESIPDGVHEPDAEQAASIIAKWNEGDPGSCKLIRRRKAGPWEPVPTEGVSE